MKPAHLPLPRRSWASPPAAGFAYVGGNGVIARHSLATGEVVNLQSQGEAKDAVIVDGVLYTGQYSSQGIWKYDPAQRPADPPGR